MQVNYVLLTGETRIAFRSVFPSVFRDEDNRISLGAYREEDGAVLGAVSFVLIDFAYSIDWLYVIPEMRRQKIATGLILEIKKFLTRTGETYPMSARFPVSEEEHSLHRFFLSLPMTDVAFSHERYYVKAEDVKNVKPLQRSHADSAKPEHFFDAPEDWQKRMLASLEQSYGYAVADYESWKNDCIPELCLYHAVQNNLLGEIFVQRASDKCLELSWIFSKYPPGLLQILQCAAEEAERLFPGFLLTFEAVNENSEKLAQRFFPGARTEHIYEADL